MQFIHELILPCIGRGPTVAKLTVYLLLGPLGGDWLESPPQISRDWLEYKNTAHKKRYILDNWLLVSLFVHIFFLNCNFRWKLNHICPKQDGAILVTGFHSPFLKTLWALALNDNTWTKLNLLCNKKHLYYVLSLQLMWTKSSSIPPTCAKKSKRSSLELSNAIIRA